MQLHQAFLQFGDPQSSHAIDLLMHEAQQLLLYDRYLAIVGISSERLLADLTNTIVKATVQ